MKARLLAASVCLVVVRPRSGHRRRAGAHEPGVGARRLHDPQEHREAAGRAQGADRRARRADRRRDAAREDAASCAGCSRKGIALLNGRPWTDAADYNAIARRADRDRRRRFDRSRTPCALEQIYAPSHRPAEHASTAHVTLRQRPAPPRRASRRGTGAVVKDLGDVRRRRARSARVAVLVRPRRARRAGRHRTCSWSTSPNQGEPIGAASLHDRAAQGARRHGRAARSRRRRARRRRCAPRSSSRSIA